MSDNLSALGPKQRPLTKSILVNHGLRGNSSLKVHGETDDTGKHSEAGKHTESQPGQGPGHGCRPSATWSRRSRTSWRAGARP